MNKENVSIMRKNAYMRIVMLTSNCVTSLSGSIFAIYTRELARTTAVGDPNLLTSINQTISSFGMLLGVSLAAYIFKKVCYVIQFVSQFRVF